MKATNGLQLNAVGDLEHENYQLKNKVTMERKNLDKEETDNSDLGAVSGSFYQDEFTRKPNRLLYKMRVLFDKHELTTWEFQEFRKMVRSFCKEYDLHFDENKEMVYKRGEQNCH